MSMITIMSASVGATQTVMVCSTAFCAGGRTGVNVSSQHRDVSYVVWHPTSLPVDDPAFDRWHREQHDREHRAHNPT